MSGDVKIFALLHDALYVEMKCKFRKIFYCQTLVIFDACAVHFVKYLASRQQYRGALKAVAPKILQSI